MSDCSVVEDRKVVVSVFDFPQTVRMAGEESWDSEIVQKAMV
ncbi:MAG: hypothetical protein QXQ48_06720 [Nitrososphaerota archaeon]